MRLALDDQALYDLLTGNTVTFPMDQVFMEQDDGEADVFNPKLHIIPNPADVELRMVLMLATFKAHSEKLNYAVIRDDSPPQQAVAQERQRRRMDPPI